MQLVKEKIINKKNKNIHAHVKNEASSPVVYKKTGGNEVEVSYNKSSELDDCFKKLGGELKVSLEKKFKSKFPLNKVWQCDEFKIVNPTNVPCSFNLFDGFSITPVPNTPNGYVPNLNPLGIPVMNFPPSVSVTYPSYECATINVTSVAPTYTAPLATTYVPSTDRIYVTVFNGSFGCVTLVINPNTNLVVNTIILPLFSISWMSVYSSVSNKVYVTDQTTVIAPIDCATETALPSITLPAAASQISYNPANNYLYVTVPSLDRLYYIDCATDTIIGFISLVGGGGSVNALVNWSNGANNYALVLNSANSTAFYINTTTNTLISTFLITSIADSFGAICYNSIKDTIYYMNFLGVINEIDMSTQTMLPTSISGLSGAFQLLFLPTYNIIYSVERAVAANANAKVINCVTNVIDLTVPTSVTFITLGSRVAYDDVNNTVWITGDGANLVISKICGLNHTCYIVGSVDYNEFLQYLRNDPVCVRQLKFFSQNSRQLTVPLQIQTKDANGNLCTFPKLPNVTLSVDQFQPNIATVDFNCKDLILDCLTTINSYTVSPQSELTFVIYYDQIYKADILSSKDTICKRLNDIKCAPVGSRDEFTLKFQSQRPHVRPKWLKPFNKNMIKDGSGGTSSDSCNTCFEKLGHPIVSSFTKTNGRIIDGEDAYAVKRLDRSKMDKLINDIGRSF